MIKYIPRHILSAAQQGVSYNIPQHRLMTHPTGQNFEGVIIIHSGFTAILGLEGNICISKKKKLTTLPL
jgi:hypothetical protein